MHNATQSTYVLTDEKFKKVAKGVKKRLNENLPEAHALSHQSILQVLSQDLFSMPYEEAKETVLKQGSEILKPSEENTGNDENKEIVYNNFRASLVALADVTPLRDVKEISPYFHVIYDFPAVLSNSGRIQLVGVNEIDKIASNWKYPEEYMFSACMLAMSHYAKQNKDELTLKTVRESATLDTVLRWLSRSDLPAHIREHLVRGLSHAGIVPDDEGTYLDGKKFALSIELWTDCLDDVESYIKNADLTNKVEDVGENYKAFGGSSKLVLLDSMMTIQSFANPFAFYECNAVADVVTQASKGNDVVTASIRQQNSLRNKEMWCQNATNIARAYSDAYLCSVGKTMMNPSLVDYQAGFNLSNLAAMVKDEELPMELRARIMTFLKSLNYNMDTDKQMQHVHEHFEYIAMYINKPIDFVLGYLGLKVS